MKDCKGCKNYEPVPKNRLNGQGDLVKVYDWSGTISATGEMTSRGNYGPIFEVLIYLGKGAQLPNRDNYCNDTIIMCRQTGRIIFIQNRYLYDV